MAHHKSCIKRIRTSEKSRQRNKAYRTQMRSVVKKVLTTDNKETAELLLKAAISLLDKMVNKGIVHRNTAARRKSVLTRRVNALA
jgi:small subunit ribosomal protein S20